MTGLLEKKCIPCSIGAVPLEEKEINAYVAQLKEGWIVKENRYIEKAYKFGDFKEALDFVNKIGAIAEEEGHHPEITLGWGRVKIKIMTFKINGLHENDFILAAKIDAI